MPTRPIFLDADLSWLIDASGISNPESRRRLNAIENQLARLARQWRAPGPIVPEREIRMSEATRSRLLAWVEEFELPDAATRARIVRYESGAVVENSVPDERVRLFLRPRRESTQGGFPRDIDREPT